MPGTVGSLGGRADTHGSFPRGPMHGVVVTRVGFVIGFAYFADLLHGQARAPARAEHVFERQAGHIAEAFAWLDQTYTRTCVAWSRYVTILTCLMRRYNVTRVLA